MSFHKKSRRNTQEYLEELQGLKLFNKSEEEYEELEKGSLQRKLPFNPKAPENQAVTTKQREWTHDEDQDVRDSIPKMEGSPRVRALNKLAAKTHVRKHPETGERLFLMHRGMGAEEYTGANKNKKTTHEIGTKTSWTPDREVSDSFAGGTGGIVSAWIPESAITHSVNQFNSPSLKGIKEKSPDFKAPGLGGSAADKDYSKSKPTGGRSITEIMENEWIVNHTQPFHHANLDALVGIDSKINDKEEATKNLEKYKIPKEPLMSNTSLYPKLAVSEKILNSFKKDEEEVETPKKPKGMKQESEKVGEVLTNLASDKQTTAGLGQRIYSMPSADKMQRSKVAQKTGQIPSSINVYGSHYPVVRLLPNNTVLLHTSPYGQEGKTEELVSKIKEQLPQHFPDSKVIEIHHPDYRHSAKIMRMRNHNTIADYLQHASENHPDEAYRQHAADAHQHLSSIDKIKKAEYGKPIHAKRTASEGFDYNKNLQGRMDRLHGYLTSIGLTPEPTSDKGRSLGAEHPTALSINPEGDPHDQQTLHEAAHAMLTSPDQTIGQYQKDIGKPGFQGKIHQTQNSASLKAAHSGGMPEQTAQHMEGLIARRAGIEPFRSPKRGKEGTQEEVSREHAKKTMRDFDSGYYKFDPFSGEKELQATPDTLINAKSHGDAGLFGKIRNKLVEQRKARASMSPEDLEDMAASEKDVSKPFSQHPRDYYKDKKQNAKRAAIAEKARIKSGAKKPLDAALDKLKLDKTETLKPHKTGDRVNHKVHGVGTVRQNHGDGQLTVGFDNSKDTSLNYKGLKINHSDLNQPKSIKKSGNPLQPEYLEGKLESTGKPKKKNINNDIQKWEGKALKAGVLALGLAHGAHYINQEATEQAKAPASREVASIPLDPAQQARNAGRQEAERDVQDIMRRNFVKNNPYKPSHVVVKETIKSNPELMNKYGYALKMSKPALSELMQNHPTMNQEVGENYHNKLNEEFGGNDEHVDHAWRNGIKATKVKFGL